MHELNPDQRRTLLKRYIDRSKINWAHIGLAQLLENKTPRPRADHNFDQLITRACAPLVNPRPDYRPSFHPNASRPNCPRHGGEKAAFACSNQ